MNPQMRHFNLFIVTELWMCSFRLFLFSRNPLQEDFEIEKVFPLALDTYALESHIFQKFFRHSFGPRQCKQIKVLVPLMTAPLLRLSLPDQHNYSNMAKIGWFENRLCLTLADSVFFIYRVKNPLILFTVVNIMWNTCYVCGLIHKCYIFPKFACVFEVLSTTQDCGNSISKIPRAGFSSRKEL